MECGYAGQPLLFLRAGGGSMLLRDADAGPEFPHPAGVRRVGLVGRSGCVRAYTLGAARRSGLPTPPSGLRIVGPGRAQVVNVARCGFAG